MPGVEFRTLKVTLADQVATIALNRPESAGPGLVGAGGDAYFFSLPMKCLRNLATLGCTTIMQ